MANKNKAKGSAYEQKIANRLTNEFNKEFRRVPLSGSIDYLKGDIWTPQDTAWWPYAIECKHYKDLQWNNLLTSKTTDILNFWRQTVREAEVMKKKSQGEGLGTIAKSLGMTRSMVQRIVRQEVPV